VPSAPVIGVVSVYDSSSVSIAFIPPNGTITGYTVTSSPGGLTGTGTTSPITVLGLTANTAYTFTVTATSASGTSVSSGISSSVTTIANAPTIGTVSASSSSSVSVDFTPPTGDGIITNYIITSSPNGLIGIGSSSPITVSGLTSNTIYTCRVTAVNSGGISVPSGISSAVTTKPSAPIIGEASVLTSSSVSVDFTALIIL
jgi:hypothetical protein